MYSDKVKKRIALLLVLMIFCVITGAAAFWGVNAGNRNMSSESLTALQQAVVSSARQCYIVEGVYPPDLAYLEENYGLQINHDDFFVAYDAFAQNLPPTVKVTMRK